MPRGRLPLCPRSCMPNTRAAPRLPPAAACRVRGQRHCHDNWEKEYGLIQLMPNRRHCSPVQKTAFVHMNSHEEPRQREKDSKIIQRHPPTNLNSQSLAQDAVQFMFLSFCKSTNTQISVLHKGAVSSSGGSHFVLATTLVKGIQYITSKSRKEHRISRFLRARFTELSRFLMGKGSTSRWYAATNWSTSNSQ